jgi:hypothetical protein
MAVDKIEYDSKIEIEVFLGPSSGLSEMISMLYIFHFTETT